jgi:hypothetical protein
MKILDSPTVYDADAICAMKKRGTLRRTFVAIATKSLGRVKLIFVLRRTFVAIAMKILGRVKMFAMNFRRYCHASYRFLKKKKST